MKSRRDVINIVGHYVYIKTAKTPKIIPTPNPLKGGFF